MEVWALALARACLCVIVPVHVAGMMASPKVGHGSLSFGAWKNVCLPAWRLPIGVDHFLCIPRLLLAHSL
jgi:hypothetical protein